MCVRFAADRVDLAHARAASARQPEILFCDSYRREGDDARLLARLRRELKLERYRCTTLLQPGAYQTFQVEAPNVPCEEARSAVRWRLREVLDYPLEAATVDALFLPAPEGAAGPAQMLAVAAKNELIEAVVRPFNEAGVPLEVIDIPELAQRNLAQRYEEPGRGLALLGFEEEGALLTFSCDGELCFARRIDLAPAAGANAAARPEFWERIALELQRSLDHFDRQFRHLAVSRVLIAPIAGAHEMRDHLAANLDLPVAVLDLAHAAECSRVPALAEPERQAQWLHAIGAALREEAA